MQNVNFTCITVLTLERILYQNIGNQQRGVKH